MSHEHDWMEVSYLERDGAILYLCPACGRLRWEFVR